MESNRITFEKLSDVKVFMELLAAQLGQKQRAAAMLIQFGMAENSPAMFEARKDTRNTVELLINVYREFSRLHDTQCQDECGVTDEMIEDAITDLIGLRDEIDKAEAVAVKMGPQSPEDARMGIMGALGALTGNPFAGPATLGGNPGSVDTRDASSGTGMYL